MKKNSITHEELYYLILAGCYKIIDKQDYLNKINVFPVPDGDTGTNMSGTCRMIIENTNIGDNIKDVLNNFAEAALMGAMGNSGIIFAQFINGLSINAEAKLILTSEEIAKCVADGSNAAINSVDKPVEGTILTVMKVWTDELKLRAKEDTDIMYAFLKSLVKLEQAVKDTEKQMDILEKAHVVDAGAQGFYEFVLGMKEFLKDGNLGKIKKEKYDNNFMKLSHDHILPETLKYRYCTEAIIELTHDIDVELIKMMLHKFGDCTNALKHSKKVKLHVHTNDPADLFYELTKFGKIVNQKIDDMLMQGKVIRNKDAKVAIVTDSGCELPKQIYDKYNINMIPFKIVFEENSYLEKQTIDASKFSKLVKTEAVYPTTSQPDLFIIQRKYEYLSSYYDDIISIHISKELSGTYNSCVSVAKNLDSNVEVINSKTLSLELGYIVLAAAIAAYEGKTKEEILKIIDEKKQRLNSVAVLDEIGHLIKGGRLGAVKGGLIKTLNLKPILSVSEEGKIKIIGKKVSKTISYRTIVKKICKNKIKAYSIAHVNNFENAEKMKELIKEKIDLEPTYILEAAPSLATHIGEGGLLVSYEEDL